MAPKAEKPEEMVRVGVVVAKRDGYTGVFAAGQHFPNGFSVADVPKSRFPQLQRKHALQMLRVVAIGEAEVKAEIEREAARAATLAEHGLVLSEGDVTRAPVTPSGVQPPKVLLKTPTEPDAIEDVTLPTLAEFTSTGAAKGLNEKETKAKYGLEIEAARAAAKKSGAKVIEPKS